MDGSELREARESLGLTPAQLGRSLGVDRATIIRWEKGEMAIRHPFMLRWALRGLGAAVPPDRLSDVGANEQDRATAL